MLLTSATVAQLLRDLLTASYPQLMQQAQQPQHAPLVVQQPGAATLSEAGLKLVAAVLQKQHWLLSEVAAAAAGAAQPGSFGQECMHPELRSQLVGLLPCWLQAAQVLCACWTALPVGMPSPHSGSAAFCSAAAAAEAAFRLQPLLLQLAGVARAAAAAGGAAALHIEAGELLPALEDYHTACCWLAQEMVRALNTAQSKPPCLADACAVQAACQLSSCAAKRVWWSEQHLAQAASCGSSASDVSLAGAAMQGGQRSGSAAAGAAPRVSAAQAEWRRRYRAVMAFMPTVHLAVAAASARPIDERQQA